MFLLLCHSQVMSADTAILTACHDSLMEKEKGEERKEGRETRIEERGGRRRGREVYSSE